MEKETILKKIFIVVLFITILLSLAYVSYMAKGKSDIYFGIYGSVMVLYLLGKMLLSFRYHPITEDYANVKVSVVVPSYNEEPNTLVKTVESILMQDYPIHEIWVVDDGSTDRRGYEMMLVYQQQLTIMYQQLVVTNNRILPPCPKLIVHRLEKNKGKRHAQIWAFQRATGDIIFTVDSDGYVYPNAVRELVKPFKDDKVMAVTGHINARNRNENWLTRLLDMRYDNAFRVERAAQSVTGNILVCSGPISCYRREVITENIEHYGNQKFLGEQVQFGDDRCLTNYAILKGKTVYQSTARCDTDVPNNFKQFITQQVRWNKSFFRESLLALKIGIQKPKVLIWVLLELSLWLMFGYIVLWTIVFKIQTFGWIILIYYLGYLTLSAYARNVFYVLKHPITFLCAPLYGLIHLCLLFPLRFYALFTLKVNGWGTR